MAKGTQPCCSECGCAMGLKLRALSTECPLDKWGPVMSDELEDQLIESINEQEQSGKNTEPSSEAE